MSTIRKRLREEAVAAAARGSELAREFEDTGNEEAADAGAEQDGIARGLRRAIELLDELRW